MQRKRQERENIKKQTDEAYLKALAIDKAKVSFYSCFLSLTSLGFKTIKKNLKFSIFCLN